MYLLIAPLFLFSLLFPLSAQAILPPDILFSIGSQIYQVFAAVGIVIVSALAAIAPLWRNFLEKIKSFRVVLLSILLFMIFCGGGFFLYAFFTGSSLFGTKVPTQVPTSTSTTIGYRFFADRFVLASKDQNGEPFLVDLDLNIKEREDGTFIHYYIGNILADGQSQDFYEQRVSSSTDILPDLFFSHFSKEKHLDHSVRDIYQFSFKLLGKEYNVITDTFTSDFITKNEPEYTSYFSSGKATIEEGGKNKEVSIMHQRSYSTDYRKSIFFEGSATLRSESRLLIIWDKDQNFYLLDQSVVKDYSPAYASHFWGLMKTSDGRTKKAFGGTIDKTVTDAGITFTSTVPQFDNAKFKLTITKPFFTKLEEGWVEGTVSTESGTKEFYGLGYQHIYGE